MDSELPSGSTDNGASRFEWRNSSTLADESESECGAVGCFLIPRGLSGDVHHRARGVDDVEDVANVHDPPALGDLLEARSGAVAWDVRLGRCCCNGARHRAGAEQRSEEGSEDYGAHWCCRIEVRKSVRGIYVAVTAEYRIGSLKDTAASIVAVGFRKRHGRGGHAAGGRRGVGGGRAAWPRDTARHGDQESCTELAEAYG
ncbi:hypothetical protein DFH08DRAFT_812127 [Mycena albidolilacea]|uniref:Uncharacterized protein n=1 Tax=Mycena albidolilacea TaxID=1033008 RepID=A0AAD6ZVB3_9AGAR|nr:hypothetical protein DFH08DRAFT_812127 [Mycena albidolilacea]